MKNKRLISLIMVFCLMLTFTSVTFAGSYEGPSYVYTASNGMNYYHHLSASANSSGVTGNAYSMTKDYTAIDSVQVSVYLYKYNSSNQSTLIKSGNQSYIDYDFASVSVSVSGWPIGASYCKAESYHTFRDTYYGNFDSNDVSTKMYQ